MTEAERSLAALCAAQGDTLLEVLRVHERKRTASAKIRRADGETALLKCLLPGAPEASARGLRAEREVYASNACALASRFIAGGEHYYVRAYEDGVPLRRFLLERPEQARAELPTLIATLVEAFAASRRPGSSAQDARTAASATTSRLHNLLTSGPSGTQRAAWATRTAHGISRGGATLATPLLRRLCGRWQDSSARYVSDLSHNDLHADNVLVTAAGPRVVDFENVTRPGFWWVDCVYLAATCHAALRAPEAKQELAEALQAAFHRAEPLMSHGLRALAEVFFSAAASNARFRGERRVGTHDLQQLTKAPRAIARLAVG